MEKINYDKKLEILVNSLDYKPNLLLHSCCGPCSSYVIDYLKDYFNICVIYYNPNIEPECEYEKRKKEQIRLIEELNLPNLTYIDILYDNSSYEKIIKGHENDPEGGERCHICYKLRLEKVASIAKEKEFDYFGTTLTVSPYKNSYIINEIGELLENKYHVKWLYSDFKKKDGYKKSVEISKKYNLYRQDYCGCDYSNYHNKEE